MLAGTTGVYREFRSAPALDAHFRCVWFNTPGRVRRGSMTIVPDGCVDIVWKDGELVVAGPDVIAAETPVVPQSRIVGIRFRPGAARLWLGLPMHEIVGHRVALVEFWGARARELAARIGDAATTAARMDRLQATLSAMAPDRGAPPRDAAFVFHALQSGTGGPGMASILDRLDLSPRTLRRRCQDAFGYGPKTLDRILRFQRFLGLARQDDAPGLAVLAVAAGYADQAHLTREVRRLSGFSPATVLAQLA